MYLVQASSVPSGEAGLPVGPYTREWATGPATPRYRGGDKHHTGTGMVYMGSMDLKYGLGIKRLGKIKCNVMLSMKFSSKGFYKRILSGSALLVLKHCFFHLSSIWSEQKRYTKLKQNKTKTNKNKTK